MQRFGKLSFVTAALVLAGCRNSTPSPAPSASASSASSPSSASVASAGSAAASGSAATTITDLARHEIAGVGGVPVWGPDRRHDPCSLPSGAHDRIVSLAKGEDVGIGDGSTDPATLATTIAESCFGARRAVATALAEGGSKLFEKKKIAEANRWWRAALVLHPQLDVARYDLARGLVRAGNTAEALWSLSELARAARDNDATASNLLEKAKNDPDFDPIRKEQAFADAVGASLGALAAPKKDEATAKQITENLPADFRIGPNPSTGAMRQYHPSVIDLFTWRPDSATELTVATLICDPAVLAEPDGGITSDYGGVAIVRRDAGKLSLVYASKTGTRAPSLAPTKNGGVLYRFPVPCGDLKGVLHWKDGKVIVDEQACGDLPP